MVKESDEEYKKIQEELGLSKEEIDETMEKAETYFKRNGLPLLHKVKLEIEEMGITNTLLQMAATAFIFQKIAKSTERAMQAIGLLEQLKKEGKKIEATLKA